MSDQVLKKAFKRFKKICKPRRVCTNVNHSFDGYDWEEANGYYDMLYDNYYCCNCYHQKKKKNELQFTISINDDNDLHTLKEKSDLQFQESIKCMLCSCSESTAKYYFYDIYEDIYLKFDVLYTISFCEKCTVNNIDEVNRKFKNILLAYRLKRKLEEKEIANKQKLNDKSALWKEELEFLEEKYKNDLTLIKYIHYLNQKNKIVSKTKLNTKLEKITISLSYINEYLNSPANY